jgi:hypothetical protein
MLFSIALGVGYDDILKGRVRFDFAGRIWVLII